MNPADLWLLERVRLGEVPPHLRERADRLLKDPASRELLHRLEAQDAADLDAHPPAREAAEVLRIAAAQERTEAARRRSVRRRAWGVGIPAAATLCLAIAFFPSRQVVETPVAAPSPGPGSVTTSTPVTAATASSSNGSVSPLPAEGTGSQTTSSQETPLAQAGTPTPPEIATLPSGVRAKGEVLTLLVHRRDEGRARRLFDGDTIRPHETLQLSVQSSSKAQVWVLSRDATGEVTVHFPESGTRSAPIDTGLHALPHAWELDESTGFERFWIVSSPAPFPLRDLEQAVRNLPRDAAVLPLPSGLSQRTFRLVKTAR